MKLSPAQIADSEGYGSVEAMLRDCMFGSRVQVPACCSHGCNTDPDGYCPHGQPSVLLEEGLC